jgi:uncharacterized membrane protein YgdD (TMEM256/DUF423 family)
MQTNANHAKFTTNMRVLIFRTGASFLAVAIAFGAFGAHYLRQHATEREQADWHTASQYLVYAGLGLLLLGLIFGKYTGIRGQWVIFALLALGAMVFSSTLYLIGAQQIIGADLRWYGRYTPIGGLAMILSWVVLAINFGPNAVESATKKKKSA